MVATLAEGVVPLGGMVGDLYCYYARSMLDVFFVN